MLLQNFVKLCGKYAPLIYSASLAYNPLEIKTIDIKETFIKNKNTSKTEAENRAQTSSLENSKENSASNSSFSKTAGTSNSASYTNGSSLNVESDTPQGQISKDEILQGKYASKTGANENSNEIQDFTNSSSNNSITATDRKSETEIATGNNSSQNNLTSNGNETEDYERIKEGYDFKETKSKLIADYRKNIINIYENIINDLNSLFFALF